MSHRNALAFLLALRAHPAMLAAYDRRDLAALIFQARNDGFAFTREELADLVGALEADVVTNRDHDPFDGSARLWRRMWGRRHLAYVVTQVLEGHSEDELRAIVERAEAVAT